MIVTTAGSVQKLNPRLTCSRFSPMLAAAPRAWADHDDDFRAPGNVERIVNVLQGCRGSRGLFRLAGPTALLTLVGCETAGPASVEFTRQGWSREGLTGRKYTTAHFDIVSTLRDPEFEQALPGFVEAAYQRYQSTLPAAPDDGTRLTMYVFGTRSEWKRYTQRHFPTRYELYRRIRDGGFTEGDVSVSFYTSRAATLATLAHEGWHQYADSRLDAPIPAWLNEGLACCHEAVEFAGRKPRFTPRHNTFRINALREAVRRDELLSLREIVDTDAGHVISRDHGLIAGVYYAQAWALITFLRHGDQGRHAGAFDEMLTDLAEGNFSVRVSAAGLTARDDAGVTFGNAAFREYFGRKPEDLQDEYYDYPVRICGF